MTRPMRAVTLWQPHAQLIALGHKPYETRSWATSHRGPIAIHASKKRDNRVWREITALDAILALSALPALPSPMPFGAIVCVASLVECYRDMPRPHGIAGQCGHFGPGRVAWHLLCIRPLREPVPCGGAQGLWGPSPEIVAMVMAQLEEAPL